MPKKKKASGTTDFQCILPSGQKRKRPLKAEGNWGGIKHAKACPGWDVSTAVMTSENEERYHSILASLTVGEVMVVRSVFAAHPYGWPEFHGIAELYYRIERRDNRHGFEPRKLAYYAGAYGPTFEKLTSDGLIRRGTTQGWYAVTKTGEGVFEASTPYWLGQRMMTYEVPKEWLRKCQERL